MSKVNRNPGKIVLLDDEKERLDVLEDVFIDEGFHCVSLYLGDPIIHDMEGVDYLVIAASSARENEILKYSYLAEDINRNVLTCLFSGNSTFLANMLKNSIIDFAFYRENAVQKTIRILKKIETIRGV